MINNDDVYDAFVVRNDKLSFTEIFFVQFRNKGKFLQSLSVTKTVIQSLPFKVKIKTLLLMKKE